MKKRISLLLLCLPAMAFGSPKLELLWQTGNLRVPESVLVYSDNNDKYLFVSEIDGEGNVADGQGGVALLNTDGSMRQHNWVRGLNAPKGLGVYQGKLYVADLTELVIIDIQQAEVINKITAPDAIFLNDITVNEQGTVYISDTRKNRVYKAENEKITVWLENINAANGLKAIGSDLYIAADDKLLKADQHGNISIFTSGFEARADGLEPIGNGDFLVTCWAGILYYVYADGRIEKLLDTREQKLNTADLGWDPQTRTLYIPTFFGNSVKAYKLSD